MNKDTKIFTLFSTFWITLCWIGFLLSLFGFFYAPIFIIILIAGALILPYIIKKYQLSLSRSFAITIFAITIFVLFFSYFTTPTIFSGRDQGSISEAAIRLSQNHQLEFQTPASEEFFKIYGPGKALNFTGFHYTQNGNLTTQFPLVYISWLAIFYSIFGLIGFKIANSILFIIFAASFYLITKNLAQSQVSSKLSALFVITSFCFSWFFKFTLTENLALALLFFGIFQITEFTKNNSSILRNISLILACSSLSLLVFTRIEGIAIFFMLILFLLFKKKSRNILIEHKLWTIFSILTLFLIFILNFIKDLSFFKEMGKAFLKSEISSVSQEINIFTAFILYGILVFLILGSVKIIQLIAKKDFQRLVPLFIALPTFVYLLNPQISSDHPWMLRRFTFSILPILILYTILLLDHFYTNNKKVIAKSLTILILSTTLPTFTYFATFSENANLLKQIESLSKQFSNDDLVLVDQEVTDDGWSMLSGPLNFIYNKHSVYFFNINDFNKIEKNNFNKIFIIIPNKNLEKYSASELKDRMHYVKDYNFTTTRLNKESTSILPRKETITIVGKIFEIK